MGRGFWYMPGSVLMGLVEGAFGGLLLVGMQRWWNPKDSRVVRIRNSVAARFRSKPITSYHNQRARHLTIGRARGEESS